MKNRTLGVGLIGCGRISQYHFDAIRKVEGLRIAAVCDVDPARAEAAGKQFDIPWFTDARELVSNGAVDLVSVCTWSGLHAEHGILAAAAGKHVITEKPMSLTMDSAARLVAACEEAKVRLFVVKQNRLNPAIQLLRKAVQQNRFGRIFLANVTVRWQRPQQYYDAESWRGTWKYDGGAIMNQASHYVDLIQWLVGPVISVSAKTATQARAIEAEDSGVAVLQFQNGALGVVEVNVLTFPKNYEGSLTILGEKGTVKIGGTSVNRVEHWEFAEYSDDDKVVDSGVINTNPPSVYGFGHEGYYRNVLAVLRGEAEAETDGREGMKSLALILAIYESARSGKPIKPTS